MGLGGQEDVPGDAGRVALCRMVKAPQSSCCSVPGGECSQKAQCFHRGVHNFKHRCQKLMLV